MFSLRLSFVWPLACLLLGVPLAAEQQTSQAAPLEIRRAETTAPAELRTLPQLVDQALANNPATREAWALALASASEVGAARSEYYPTIDAEVEAVVRYFEEPDFPGAQSVNQVFGGPALALSYLLLDFGGRDARVAMAQAELQAADSQFRQIVQDTLLAVLTAYADVAAARLALDAAEAALAYQNLNLAAVETGLEAGLYVEADALSAVSFVEQARGQVQTTRGMLASALGALNTACGRKANQPLRTTDLPRTLSVAGIDRSVDTLIQDSLQSRPEIAVAFAEVRVKDETIREVESTYWPTITFDMEGYYAPETSTGRKLGVNFTDSQPYAGAAAGITIEWELFDGFYRDNKVRAAREEAQAARDALWQTKLTTVQEVWDAYYDYLTAARNLLFSEAALKAINARLDIAEGGVATGLTNDIELAAAISEQRLANAAETQARALWMTSAVRLIYTTGRLTRNSLAR